MIPPSSQALAPTESFDAGMPKRMNELMPRSSASPTSSTSVSGLSWKLPGIEPIACRTFVPGRTKSGRMKSPTESSVSRTSERRIGEERKRRRRSCGNWPKELLMPHLGVSLDRGGDARARRRLRPLLDQTLLQRGEQLHDAVGPAVVTHQPDAPDLALELAQSAADLDPVVGEQLLPHGDVIDPGGDAHGIELRKLVGLVCAVLQAERIEPRPQRLLVAAVAGPARLQAFLQHEPQAFTQSIDHGDRRGVVVSVLLAPVLLHGRHVEVPALALRLAAVDHVNGSVAERDWGEARRAAEAFLRATVDRVDLPLIDFQRRAAERGDGVNQQQRVELVAKRAELINGLERPS